MKTSSPNKDISMLGISLLTVPRKVSLGSWLTSPTFILTKRINNVPAKRKPQKSEDSQALAKSESSSFLTKIINKNNQIEDKS